MNAATIIIVAVTGAALAFAVRYVVRHGPCGGCGGDCHHCGGNCRKCLLKDMVRRQKGEAV